MMLSSLEKNIFQMPSNTYFLLEILSNFSVKNSGLVEPKSDLLLTEET